MISAVTKQRAASPTPQPCQCRQLPGRPALPWPAAVLKILLAGWITSNLVWLSD